jgi:hypothetical protein
VFQASWKDFQPATITIFTTNNITELSFCSLQIIIILERIAMARQEHSLLNFTFTCYLLRLTHWCFRLNPFKLLLWSTFPSKTRNIFPYYIAVTMANTNVISPILRLEQTDKRGASVFTIEECCVARSGNPYCSFLIELVIIPQMFSNHNLPFLGLKIVPLRKYIRT